MWYINLAIILFWLSPLPEIIIYKVFKVKRKTKNGVSYSDNDKNNKEV